MPRLSGLWGLGSRAMGSPELRREVRQHANDVVAIYEIVSEHTEDLAEIKATLAEHTATLVEHGATLTEVRSALAEVGSKVDEQGTKLDELLALLRGGTGKSTTGV